MPKKRLKTSAIKRLRIRLAYLMGKDTMEQIAQEFGVTQGTVSRLLVGFERGNDRRNLDELWDRWCREAPKRWELDLEDFHCVIAGCWLRQLQLKRAKGATMHSLDLGPAKAATAAVETLLRNTTGT